MPSILDVAPPELSAETKVIRGTPLNLQGIPGDQWALLYSRFPAMRLLVVGGEPSADQNIELLKAQLALIAAGMGQLGNDDIERAVLERLTPDERQDLTQTIMRLSVGRNLSPLLDGAAAGADDRSTAAPATR